MVDPVLYDARGSRIELKGLEEEQGAPALASIRNVWFEPVASGLTPHRLASLLQEAVHGTARSYLTLAEEMEERDLHYSSVLRTRKLAVAGIQPSIVPGGEDALDKALADEVTELIRRPLFGDVVVDLLDAIGKAYSVIEILWDRGARWEPECFKWRDPRFFRYDLEIGEELRLFDEKDPVYGLPLQPYKWIVHRPRLKTGLPIRGGLARLASVAYMCKSFGLKDWLTFADIYGIPMRIGRYGMNASDDDKAKLVRAVMHLGSDAAAVLPEGMTIDFQAAAGGAGGTDLFERLAKFWDSQTSKAVLGQTMTTDDGSSLAQGQVHNEVRKDLRDADILQVERTIDAHLVVPYIDLNHGPQKRYPRFKLQAMEPEDLKAFSAAIVPLIDRGLRIEQAPVAAKFRLKVAPPDAADVLRPATTKSSPTGPTDPGDGNRAAWRGPKE